METALYYAVQSILSVVGLSVVLLLFAHLLIVLVHHKNTVPKKRNLFEELKQGIQEINDRK